MIGYGLFSIVSLYFLTLNIFFSILIFRHVKIINLIFYILESMIVSSLLLIFINIFSISVRPIVLVFFLFLINLICIVQYIHYSFTNCFCSTFSFIHGKHVFYFLSSIVKTVLNNIGGCIFLFINFIVVLIFVLKVSFAIRLANLLLILLSSFIIQLFIVLFSNSDDLYSKKNLLTKTNFELKNVQNFGLISAMAIDFYRYLFGANYDLFVKESNKKYGKSKYNIKELVFEKTTDKKVNNLHKYIKNCKPTSKNEYTGIFKDKNLIFITAESFSFGLIDKKHTPTLYKLSHEGLNFTNFYTPIYYASTSDGEYANLTGLFPKEGTWSYVKMRNNIYPYTYASIFKDRGYSLNAYHNGYFHIYSRHVILPHLGYDYKAYMNGLEKYMSDNLWPQSDDEMILNTYNDYKDKDRFHVFYTTVSGHLPYDFKRNDMSKKHKDVVNNLKYSKSVKAYISANIDLERALAHLLNNLERDNILNDTVIVLVPDHFPYGLLKKEYSELTRLDTEYSKHKSGLIIYNPGIKKKKIDKYASNIDVLPTLLNMFGVEYDSRLLIGQDIMSDSEGIVIFNDHSFITKKGYYNEKGNNTLKDKQKEVFNKINASSLIFDTNYYQFVRSSEDEK